MKTRNTSLTGKRGQITIFIIIAIIILFAVALVLYISYGVNRIKPPVQSLTVSDTIRPVQVYATSCLDTISKDALVRLGSTGGFTSLEGKKLKISPVSYKSDVFIFSPDIMPYWYHLRECTQNPIGCLESRMPPLCSKNVKCVIPDASGANSMQEELESYVNAHLDDCIQNFTALKDRYDITAGKLKTTVFITEKSVDFKIDYPITVKVKGQNVKEDIPYFFTSQDVKLKDIYFVSRKIYDAESKQQFIETATMNLVSIYSAVDPNMLPPTSQLEFNNKNPQTWSRTNVQQSLQDDILPYINFIRISGTRNDASIVALETSDYTLYAQGIYNSMNYKFFNETYDLDVNIIYPYSDIYLNVGGSEVIKGERLYIDPNFKFIMNLVGFGMTQYKAKYDIRYPVVVKLTDPEAFNGQGYSFNYAMEANIRQNIPVTQNVTLINFISNSTLPTDIPRVNRTVYIEAVDRHTRKPLSGVIITYRCGVDYDIGETEMQGGKAIVADKLPYCIGGEIIYQRDGYMGSSIAYYNDEGTDEKHIAIEMWPIAEKPVQVYKRTALNVQHIQSATTHIQQVYDTEQELLDVNDSVYMNIERVKEQLDDQDIPIIGFQMITPENTSLIALTAKEMQRKNVEKLYTDGNIDEATRDELLADIDLTNTADTVMAPEGSAYIYSLVPGDYSMDATLVHNGMIRIPEKTIEYCKGWDTGVAGICIGGWEEVKMPEQNISNWPKGGGQINFTLTESEVYGSNALILYVLEMPLPQTWDDMQNYQSIQDYEKNKLYTIRPEMR